jgi:hypothetical protein
MGLSFPDQTYRIRYLAFRQFNSGYTLFHISRELLARRRYAPIVCEWFRAIVNDNIGALAAILMESTLIHTLKAAPTADIVD